jgi:hypothetical protein
VRVAINVTGLVTGLLVVSSIGSVARAQSTTATQASNAAGALFDKGRQYLAAGKYAEACAAFEQSQRLDPQLGTLFNLATCNEHLGKLATAWGQFHDIAQRDANKTRRQRAASEAGKLVPRLPKLVIKLEPAVPDATVTSNGVDVGALLGIESPVDLGDYVVVARAPGYAESRATARVTDEGKTVAVSIALARPRSEAIKPATAPPGESPRVAPPVARPAAEPSPPVAPPSSVARSGPEEPSSPAAPPASNRRTLGIVALAGGGALIAGGLVLGKLASDRWSDAKAVCGPGVDCATPDDLTRAQYLTSQARVRGNLATASIIAGAAVVGVGVYLWLRAPSSTGSVSARLVPRVDPTGAGIALEGRL